MRISDWSSDVCSSDLRRVSNRRQPGPFLIFAPVTGWSCFTCDAVCLFHHPMITGVPPPAGQNGCNLALFVREDDMAEINGTDGDDNLIGTEFSDLMRRSEEHTSELQSLMRISYAVF